MKKHGIFRLQQQKKTSPAGTFVPTTIHRSGHLVVYATSALEEQSTPAFLKAQGKKTAGENTAVISWEGILFKSIGWVSKMGFGGEAVFCCWLCFFNALMHYVDGRWFELIVFDFVFLFEENRSKACHESNQNVKNDNSFQLQIHQTWS